MSLLYYGAHQYFVTKGTYNKMIQSTEFNKFKAVIVKQLKFALNLPKKGKVEPMLEMFFKYKPENIITTNYL